MAAEAGDAGGSYRPVRISASLADPADVESAVAAITAAKRPVIVAGRGVLHAGASATLQTLAEVLCLPVMTTLAGKSAFPEDHPLALGTGGLSSTAMVDQFLGRADLIVGLGTSFTKSHYTSSPPPGRTIIQVTNDPQDVCKSFEISHLLLGDLRHVLRQMLDAARDRLKIPEAYETTPLAGKIQAVKRAFLAQWMPRLTSKEEPMSPYRVIWELMHTVDRTTTVLTHDFGNPRDQIIPFYEAVVPYGYIGWGKSTQLGTGLGLTMGAKLAKPEWLAVNIMGDASFGMVGLDIETAARCEIPILTIVLNNGIMGGYEHWLPVATSKYQVHHQGGNYTKVAHALGVTARTDRTGCRFGQRAQASDTAHPRGPTGVARGHDASRTGLSDCQSHALTGDQVRSDRSRYFGRSCGPVTVGSYPESASPGSPRVPVGWRGGRVLLSLDRHRDRFRPADYRAGSLRRQIENGLKRLAGAISF